MNKYELSINENEYGFEYEVNNEAGLIVMYFLEDFKLKDNKQIIFKMKEKFGNYEENKNIYQEMELLLN